jgi:diguanylate cyclase (GGDEF)-like protein
MAIASNTMSATRSRLVGLLAGALVLVLCLHVGHLNGFITSLQNKVTEARAAHSPRPVSGDIVLVAIDKQSIDHVGRWPWPRRVHAELIDRLVDAGATDIAFDIDFSTPSNPEDDRLLAQALERAGGAVILAAFRQPESAGSTDGPLAHNLPISSLLQHAWPGSVNVLADRDGVVRRFPYRQWIGGEFVASIPALIAGQSGSEGDLISIDFSVDAAGIPVIPVKSLLEGKVSDGALSGKKVIVGATAMELRDSLAVPVHGIVSGSELQLLAAETLLQHRSPVAIDRTMTQALSFALLFLLALVSIRIRLSRSLLVCLLVAVVAEACGLWLYDAHAIVAETVPLHIGLICLAGATIAAELDGRRMRAAQAKVVIDNYRNVLGQVFEDSFDAVLVASGDGVIEFASGAAQRLLAGDGGGSLAGLRLADVVPAGISEDALKVLEEPSVPGAGGRQLQTCTLESGASGRRHVEYVVTPSRLRSDAESISATLAEGRAVCITARDVTDLVTNTRKLEHLALHDHLTAVLRREAFAEAVEIALSRKDKSGQAQEFALVAVNLEHFAVINGNFGRQIGDKVLVEIANRLAYFAGDRHRVARLDGSTFAVVLETKSPDRHRAQAIADAMLGQVEQPLTIDGHQIQPRSNIGMVGSWQVARQAEALLSAAEAALDIAKRTNSRDITWFNLVLARDIERSRLIERHLWQALKRDELVVVFQPLVNLATRRIVGAEALARWKSEALGDVSPGEFISVAEASGAIHEIGRFVLRQACIAARSWPGELAVAVNVSPVQMDFSDMSTVVRQVLAETGLPAHRLHIELTETSLMTNHEFVVHQIQSLRQLGVKIALDDFGTGHYSFEYLANLPIDKIKIDQSFVRKMLKDTKSQPIIQAVLGLASGLKLNTVCEGVETDEQALLLKLAGCIEGQGYLFGKPLGPAEFLDHLTAEEGAAVRGRDESKYVAREA